MITLREHITGLFFVGMFYWLTDDELGAVTCWNAAVQVLNSNVTCVGET